MTGDRMGTIVPHEDTVHNAIMTVLVGSVGIVAAFAVGSTIILVMSVLATGSWLARIVHRGR
jgi:hypothetical protein